MRRFFFVLLFVSAFGCHRDSPDPANGPASGTEGTQAGRAPVADAASRRGPAFPLRVEGTGFVDAAGRPFEWRGITAFRLAEMIAGGREAEATAYLDWAASEDLSVVRVLLMAKHLFELSPDRGRGALPRLLDLAKARGIAVEAVALADTDEYEFDIDAHVREVGAIAGEKGNAFVEIANEPGHPTQDERLHEAAFAKRLAELVPDPVVVALGSIEYGDGYASADYATTHVARGEEPWDHVLNIAKSPRSLGKPLISDEPIGAARQYERGRRDDDPARFAAAAALTRLTGMHATFHYEGGLQARIPEGREAACLAAWQMGLTLVDAAHPVGEFVEGNAVNRVARVAGARAVFARIADRRATILLIDPQKPAVEWAAGWSEAQRSGVPGFLLLSGVRRE